MKKVTQFLRFLSLMFFLFLALAVCFVFNKVLDQKIEEQHAQTIEAIDEYNKNSSEK